MTKIKVTHVGSLPRTQEVVDLIFAREIDYFWVNHHFCSVLNY